MIIIDIMVILEVIYFLMWQIHCKGKSYLSLIYMNFHMYLCLFIKYKVGQKKTS